MATAVLEKKHRFGTLVRPVFEVKKKSFKEAIAECNGITVDEFFDELDARIKKQCKNIVK